MSVKTSISGITERIIAKADMELRNEIRDSTASYRALTPYGRVDTPEALKQFMKIVAELNANYDGKPFVCKESASLWLPQVLNLCEEVIFEYSVAARREQALQKFMDNCAAVAEFSGNQ